MRKKLAVLFFTVIFIFSQAGLADAKGFSSSRSSSFGGVKSGSFSTSGYKGSSSSSRSIGGSSSKSSSYSGSSKSFSSFFGSSGSSSSSKSSRSVPGSYSDSSSSSKSSGGSYSGSSLSSAKSSGSTSSSVSSSKGFFSGAKSKNDTLKNSYMQETFKKEISKNNFTTYKQNLTDEQKKIYEISMNNSYNIKKIMNFEEAMSTRSQRISTFDAQPVRIHVNVNMFSGPLTYGSAFVGPWDLWFLLRASDLFWYHHWLEIVAYKEYFDAKEFAERERIIQQMEAQNIPRDPSYLDPGVDYDLQFSSEYQQNNIDRLYYTDKYAKPVKNPLSTLLTALFVIIVLIMIIRISSKPRVKKTYNRSGGIY